MSVAPSAANASADFEESPLRCSMARLTGDHMRLLLACIAMAVSGAPAMAADPAKPKTSRAEDVAREQLTASLRAKLIARLKDPESARFKDEFLSLPEDQDSDTVSLCGQVNAKNSYGGYTGFSSYIVSTSGMVIMDTADVPSATTYLWPVWCGRPTTRPAQHLMRPPSQ